MRKVLKHILHQFDVWYVGKNIKKKLVKLAKKKSCRSLNQWIKAIINHFWWCCASCEGDPKNLKEKWLGILYHITDRHRWKGLNGIKVWVIFRKNIKKKKKIICAIMIRIIVTFVNEIFLELI